jgi:diketogulonate reductase-like aldo/keto reductase
MATSPKKPATKRSPKKAVHKGYRSFKKAERTEPFFTFQFTQQTLYWLILGVLVIGLGVWVMALNMKVQAIYDQIEQDSSVIDTSELKR